MKTFGGCKEEWKSLLVSCLRVNPRERVAENDSSLLSESITSSGLSEFAAVLSHAIQAVPLLLVENEYWRPFHQQQCECRVQVWYFKAGSFVCACEEAKVVFEEEV